MSGYIFRHGNTVVGRRDVEFTPERDSQAVAWALEQPYREVDKLHDEPLTYIVVDGRAVSIHVEVLQDEFLGWCPCGGRCWPGRTSHGEKTVECDSCDHEVIL